MQGITFLYGFKNITILSRLGLGRLILFRMECESLSKIFSLCSLK